jgi:ATP-dependent DNA ligase
VIAKRRNSSYQPGKRSGAWIKMRVNRGQELIIGGYVPAPKNFDSIVVGYYEDKQLIYVARVRNGFTPASREALFKRFRGLVRGLDSARFSIVNSSTPSVWPATRISR